jgi:hypothetical protein
MSAACELYRQCGFTQVGLGDTNGTDGKGGSVESYGGGRTITVVEFGKGLPEGKGAVPQWML